MLSTRFDDGFKERMKQESSGSVIERIVCEGVFGEV